MCRPLGAESEKTVAQKPAGSVAGGGLKKSVPLPVYGEFVWFCEELLRRYVLRERGKLVAAAADAPIALAPVDAEATIDLAAARVRCGITGAAATASSSARIA